MDSLLLGGVGMITPVGIGASMVNTSIRAGIKRFTLTDILGDIEAPTKVALVPNKALENTIADTQLKGSFNALQRRMLAMASQALSNLKPSIPDVSIPLFLAGAEPYVQGPSLNQYFIERLSESARIKIDIPNSRTLNIGRAGGVEAIEIAFKYMSSTQAHYALVGGVDSFYDFLTMDYLYESSRLLNCSNGDGFIPGEGAGFILLVSPNAPDIDHRNVNTVVYRPGLHEEASHLYSEEQTNPGGGLSQALRQAFSALNNPTEIINDVYTSGNGERYYAQELSVSLMRNQKLISKPHNIIRPADSFGDLGAAFAPIAIGLASENMAPEKTKVSSVFCSSDSSARGVICLKSYTQPTQR